MTNGPLNPLPRLEHTADGRTFLHATVTHCNACEQPIRDGDDIHIRAVLDPDTGERWTVAHHEPACPPPCECGHPRHEHFGTPGRGECMASTDAETWACACHEYRPTSSPM